MEFFEKLNETDFNQFHLSIGGIILLIFILLLFRGPLRPTAQYPSQSGVTTAFSKVTSPSAAENSLKDSYSSTVSAAMLMLGGSKEKLSFLNLAGITWDEETFEIVLEQISNEISIRLGAHDLMVVNGKPERCDFSSSCLVRIWSQGELIYEERLANFTCDGQLVTG